MKDNLDAAVYVRATMGAGHACHDNMKVRGRFSVVCHEYDGGPELWREDFDNVVCTVGKNELFQAALTGSDYSVTGPFMGLISSVSFSAVSDSDTMASHSDWLEADSTNAPAYTISSSAQRGAAAFGTASAGAIAITPLVFTFTNSGTVEGAFIAFGSGAVVTWQSTAGTLLSAGTFSTAQPVISGNTLTVSYSISM